MKIQSKYVDEGIRRTDYYLVVCELRRIHVSKAVYDKCSVGDDYIPSLSAVGQVF